MSNDLHPVGGAAPSSTPPLTGDDEDAVDSTWSLLRRRFGRTGAALTLPVLVDELGAWLEYGRPKAIRKNRSYLLAELNASLAATTKSLARTVGASLDDFEAAVRQAVLEGNELADAVAATVRLRAVLSRSAVRQSAWDDVVAAAVDADIPLDEAAQRVAQLEALRLLVGWEARPATRLTAILEDDANAVASAEVHLGRRSRPEQWFDAQATAGTSPSGRLALCRDFVAVDLPPTRCVVWLAYERAHLRGPVVEAGNVTFVRHEELKARIEREGTTEAAELRDAARLPNITADQRVTFARVVLERQPSHTALGDARRLVEAITGHVGTAAIGNVWKPLGWELALFEGQGGTESGFMPPDAVADIDRTFDHHRVAERLEHEAPRLSAALGRRLPFERQMAEALSCTAAAKHADPRNRLLLLSRCTEFAVSAAGFDTVDDIDKLVEELWADAVVRDAIRHATLRAIGREESLARRPELDAIAAHVLTTTTDTWTSSVSLRAVVDHRDRLLELGTDSVERRNVTELLRCLTAPSHFLATFKHWRNDAALWTARCRRARNAVVHGNPLDERVLGRVLPFAQFTADVALHLAVDIMTGESPADAPAAMLAGGQAERGRIARGERPAQVLDPPSPSA